MGENDRKYNSWIMKSKKERKAGIMILTNGCNGVYFDINYCPICGRKVSDWVESKIYIDFTPCHNNNNEIKVECPSYSIPDKILEKLYDLAVEELIEKSRWLDERKRKSKKRQ